MMRVSMILLAAVAFGLRIWGVWFDLPFISHPDEPHEVHRALRLGAGDFEFDRIGKGGYFYLLFGEYGILFLILRILNVVQSPEDFASYFVDDPTVFWLIGRATTAVLGTFCIILVVAIGRKLYGYKVGIVAGTFLAFSSLHALHSHYVTVDIPMTACVLAAMYFAVTILETDSWKPYFWAGLLAGCAVMTKLSAAPIVLVVAVAHFMRWRSTGKASGRLLSTPFAIGVLTMAAVYILGNPGVLVGAKILGTLKGHAHIDASLEPGFSSESVWLAGYYANVLERSLGLPLFALVVLGFFWGMYRHDRRDLLMAVFPVALFLAVSFTGMNHLRNPRYIIPVLPFLFIFGAFLLAEGIRRLKLSKRGEVCLLALAVAGLCAPGGYAIVEQNTAFTRPGTPVLAKDWIEANIPSGTKILMEGYRGAPSERRLCPLRDTSKNMEIFAKELESKSPMGALYARKKSMSLRAGGKVEYDLVVIPPRDEWISWDDAKSIGIEYVIISVERFVDPPRRHSETVKQSRMEFYRRMVGDPKVELVKRFYPKKDYEDHATQRGFHIEIYRLPKGGHRMAFWDCPFSSGPKSS